ncbi:MAG: hypothetical protein ACREKF_13425 [Candidatus Methylomirabilales bacterium]
MKESRKLFALCIDNTDYQASLVLGKVYRIIPDPKAAKDDLVRIVDESDEDYLYHKSHFVFVEFPKAVAKKILSLHGATA